MWLEAIISQEDLVQALRELLPVKIHLDQQEGTDGKPKEDQPERSLFLDTPTEVILVAEQGIRVICPAELTWSIAGMSPSMKIDSLQVMIRPEVVEKAGASALEFGLQVETVDFHSLPAFIDATIVKAVNAALASKKPSWTFSETLTRTVGLGTLFEPVDALKLAVTWGKTKIGGEALGLVIAFKLGFRRAG